MTIKEWVTQYKINCTRASHICFNIYCPGCRKLSSLERSMHPTVPNCTVCAEKTLKILMEKYPEEFFEVLL